MSITIPIITEFTGKGLERAKREFAQLEGAGAKAGFILKKAMLPTGAAVAAIGVAAVEAAQQLGRMANMAAEDQKSQIQLATSIKASTDATNAQIAAVEKFIDRTARQVGVADDKLRPAFGRLVRSTKDVEKAQRLLTLSLDLSAATGRPLEAIANALGRAYDGQTASLGRLGVGLDKATLKTASFDEIQTMLERRFSGSADKAASSFEGRMQRLTIAMDELQEQIGYVVMEALSPFVDAGLRIMDAYGEKGAAGAIQQLKFELGELAKTTQIGKWLENLYNGIKRVHDAIRIMNNVARNAPGGLLTRLFGRAIDRDLFPEIAPMQSWGDLTNVAPVVTPSLPTAPSPIDLSTPRVSGRVSARSMQQINVTVTSADPRAVVDALERYNRQNGAIPVTVK